MFPQNSTIEEEFLLLQIIVLALGVELLKSQIVHFKKD